MAYQNLYTNKNGIRDSCARFWATVAEAFAGNPYIIGYDIINEPWAGEDIVVHVTKKKITPLVIMLY